MQSAIRENANLLTGFNCFSGGGMGFAKILAWDAILGKKTVMGIGMAEVQDAELS